MPRSAPASVDQRLRATGPELVFRLAAAAPGVITAIDDVQLIRSIDSPAGKQARLAIAAPWSPGYLPSVIEAPTREMVLAAQAGLEPHLTRVLEYLYTSVRKHVGFLTGFRSYHEDVVQEAMVQIHRALPTFAGRATLRTWALRIASRTARRYRDRRLADEPVLPPSEPTFEVDHDSRERLGRLSELLGLLHPKKREAFILIDVLGLTAEETAGVLGVLRATAESRCRLAREEILRHLERDQRVAEREVAR